MRRLARMAGFALVGSLTVSLPAQQRPDFSGEWTTLREVEAGAGPARRGAARGARGARGQGGRRGRGPAADMGSGFGPTITIAQDAARLTIVYPFFRRGDLQPPLTFVFALDGSETTNAVSMGRGVQEQVSHAAWDGDSLVITTRHAFEDPATGAPMSMEVRQVLSLESPTSLVIETTRAGVLGGEPSTTRTTYRKVE
jgi:hypothetical protein